MWLSLIWIKVKSPLPAARVWFPKARDDKIPLLTVQASPVPAQAIHSRNPRRSIPSPGWSWIIASDMNGLLENHLTTIRAVILGWRAQKYSYVPGVVNRCVNWSSVSRVLESKLLGFAVLVAVCGTSSRLTQVTIVPALMVSVRGLKVKLSMTT